MISSRCVFMNNVHLFLKEVCGPSLQSVIYFQATRVAQRPKHVAPATFGWKILPAGPAVYLVGCKESPGQVWKVCETAVAPWWIMQDVVIKVFQLQRFSCNGHWNVRFLAPHLFFRHKTLSEGFKFAKKQSVKLLHHNECYDNELIHPVYFYSYTGLETGTGSNLIERPLEGTFLRLK